MMAAEDQYLLKNRDEAESDRLDFQHRLALDCCNGFLIHPLIDTSNFTGVADIGTGTGIWIEEVYSELSHDKSEKRVRLRCDGFDISSAQYPTSGNAGYFMQDILKPFSKEFHGIYDLVHVRHLILALKKDQYGQAVQNVLTLLKPGGYIQWEELDVPSVDPHYAQFPILTRVINLCISFFSSHGMDGLSSNSVVSALQNNGFEGVVREERNSYWSRDLELAVKLGVWLEMSAKQMCIPSLIAKGEVHNKESASLEVDQMFKELNEEYGNGSVPNFPLRIVVGRKPL